MSEAPPQAPALPYYRPKAATLEHLKTRHENQKMGDFEKAEYVSPADGNNTYRILPPMTEDGEFFSEQWSHFNIPTFGKKGIRCLDAYPSTGVPCPVCAVLKQAEKMGVDYKTKLAKWKPGKKGLLLAVDRSAAYNKPTEPPKVVVLTLPMSQINAIGYAMSNPAFADALHPLVGCDLNVNKSGANLDTKYTTGFAIIPGGDPRNPQPFQTPLLPNATPDQIAAFMKTAPSLKQVNHPPFRQDLDEIWSAATLIRQQITNESLQHTDTSGWVPSFANLNLTNFKERKSAPVGAETGSMTPPPGYTAGFTPPGSVHQAPAPYTPPAAPPVQPAPYTPPAPPAGSVQPFAQPQAPQAPYTPPAAPPAPAPAAPVQQTPTHPPVTFQNPTPPSAVGGDPQVAQEMNRIANDPLLSQEQPPDCYAGNAKNANGGYGPDNNCDKCLYCVFDAACGTDYKRKLLAQKGA